MSVPEMWDAWCSRCHAKDGSGKVTEPTVTVEPMDFTDCRIASPEPDADWQLAIVHGGRISVFEFGTGRLVGVTAGTFDANPAWSVDGTRIGFGEVAGTVRPARD